MSEPTTQTPPPTTPTTQAPPASPPANGDVAANPIIARIRKGFAAARNEEPEPLPESEVEFDSKPMGELLAEQAERAALEKPKAEGSNQTKEVISPEKPAETPVETAPAKPAVKVKKSRAQELAEELRREKAKPAPPQPTPPSKPELNGEPKAPPPPDAFEATLTDEQKEELELARFAETKFPQAKGKAAETLAFYKKVDEFARTHTDLTPESDEFREWLGKNQPKYPDGLRRKIEMAAIEEAAYRRAKEEMEPTLEELREKQRQLELNSEIKPKVEKLHREFASRELFSEDLKLPEDMPERLDPKVATLIEEEGYAAAVEQEPFQAPLYQSTVDAAKAYLEIVHKLTPFNAADPVHRWLAGFLEHQGRVWNAQPEEARVRMMDGERKTFVPLAQYARLSAEEARKHWTFSDAEVLMMLAYDAHVRVNQRAKQLEREGYKRQSSPKGENPAPAQNPKPATKTDLEDLPPNPPLAGRTIAPGAGVGGPNGSPIGEWWETRFKGASKLV